jgi:hypothetical protein
MCEDSLIRNVPLAYTFLYGQENPISGSILTDFKISNSVADEVFKNDYCGAYTFQIQSG